MKVTNDLNAVVELIRMRQWPKNLLLFLPTIAFHKFYDINNYLQLVAGVVAFSFFCSAGYIFNDLVDAKFGSFWFLSK